MLNTTQIIGYVASTGSVLAFGSQFYHSCKTKATAGLSLHRTIFDTGSLALWVAYATRVEDIPLLIATTAELFFSLCVCIVVFRNRNQGYTIKDFTPPSTPPRISFDGSTDEVVINIATKERRNSV